MPAEITPQHLAKIAFIYVRQSTPQQVKHNLQSQQLQYDLIDLAKGQFDMPLPVERVCLGPIIDQTQYRTDIMDSEFKVITIKTI